MWELSSVLSVEKESTTTTSSAIPMSESRQRPMFFSSLKVMMTAEIRIISINGSGIN
jgi:hypothetical protein